MTLWHTLGPLPPVVMHRKLNISMLPYMIFHVFGYSSILLEFGHTWGAILSDTNIG